MIGPCLGDDEFLPLVRIFRGRILTENRKEWINLTQAEVLASSRIAILSDHDAAHRFDCQNCSDFRSQPEVTPTSFARLFIVHYGETGQGEVYTRDVAKDVALLNWFFRRDRLVGHWCPDATTSPRTGLRQRALAKAFARLQREREAQVAGPLLAIVASGAAPPRERLNTHPIERSRRED